MERNSGWSTFSERERVLLVGPMAPATKRGRSGVFKVQASAAFRAIRTAARLISSTASERPYSAWATVVPLKVFVSMMSAPASRKASCTPRRTSGRVMESRSWLPFRVASASANRAPR